jgi:hypothetical protein
MTSDSDILHPREAGRQAIAGVPSVQSARRAAASPQSLRQIALVIDPAALRRFHLQLAGRLARDTGARVVLVRGKAAKSLPGSVELLLRLERLLHGMTGPRWSDRVEWDQWASLAASTADTRDLVIDLAGVMVVAGTRTLRVTYDRSAEEAALFGALLAGRMPSIEVEDVRTGEVLGRGVPCAENAGTVLAALEAAMPRIADLLSAVLRGWTTLSAPPAEQHRNQARLRDVVAFEARSLSHALARRLYHLCCHAPHWRVLWRFVGGRGDLWDSRSVTGSTWNVLPDPGDRFYADPFPIVHGGQTFVFVEDFDHRTGRGRISAVPFDERGPAGPARPVLEEPWHLSYPFVFAQDGEVWMIPESSERRSVILYRAAPFPYRWVREAVLLDDIDASDATIVRHAGHLWMFTVVRDNAGSWSDRLSIFSAPTLRGPWRPHPGNPVVIDQATARPAGAFIRRDGRLWRPVQDCSAGYGTGIGLVEVVRLDDEAYEQRQHALIRSDPSWPGRRLHTLNRAGRIEVVDGSAHSPRSRFLAQRLEAWSGRREFVENSTPVGRNRPSAALFRRDARL